MEYKFFIFLCGGGGKNGDIPSYSVQLFTGLSPFFSDGIQFRE